jgi:hypothetical protein
MLYPLPPLEPRASGETDPRRGPHSPCQPDAARGPTTPFPAYTRSPARHRIPIRSVLKHGALKHDALNTLPPNTAGPVLVTPTQRNTTQASAATE